MADPNSTNDTIANIGNIIAAVAALGTASMGLVDASKAIAGGPSNIGFRDIETALSPFLPAKGVGAYNRTLLLLTLRANWINGVDKAEQKAKAKSLIHLGLSKGNAAHLAEAAGVDPVRFESLAQKTASGLPATPEEITALGQFDAILSALLDAAYERADQKYRDACKAIATILATALGVVAGLVIGGFSSIDWIIGLMAGVIAVPLAPVAKDLVSSLQAAAAAVQTTRRGVRR